MHTAIKMLDAVVCPTLSSSRSCESKHRVWVVGAMTIGVAYTLLRDYVWHPKTEEELHEMYRPHGHGVHFSHDDKSKSKD